MKSRSVIKPLSRNAQFFQASLIYIIVVSQILPQLRALPFYTYLWLVPMLSWLTFIWLMRPSFFIKSTILIKTMLFFIVYSVAIPYLFGNPSIGNRYLSLAQIPLFYFAFSFNETTKNSKTNYSIIKFSIPLILFTIYKTINGLIIDPWISRAIKSSEKDSIPIWQKGIGGYDFIYFITIVSLILVAILIFHKSIRLSFKYRISGLIILSSLIATVILSNYFTALIMLVVSAILVFLLKKMNPFLIVLMVILSLVSLIWGKQIFLFILDSLTSILPKGKTELRLNEIAEALVHGKATDMQAGRESVMNSSIEGFIKNPLFGMVIQPLNIKGQYLSGFGQHSQFLDTLALFGIIGFLQVYTFIKPFIQRTKDNVLLRSFSLSILSAVLILNIFNNSAPLIGFAYFFIYPTFYSWLKMKMEPKSIFDVKT